MQTITGINYYEKTDHIIKECLKEASKHPTQTFYYICDHPKSIEQCFFKYTKVLFNIEIVSFNSFVSSMLEKLCLAPTILDQTELLYYVYTAYKSNTFQLFKGEPSFSFLEPLSKLMTDYNTFDIHLSQITSSKLEDFHLLYQSVNQIKPNDTFYSRLDALLAQDLSSLSQMNIYIEGDHLIYKSLVKQLLDLLSKSNDIKVLLTTNDEQELYNIPYLPYKQNENKFKTTTDHVISTYQYYNNTPCFTFKAKNPLYEVKYTLHSIKEKIVNEHLSLDDFVIYVPNTQYFDDCLQEAIKANIPVLNKEMSLFEYSSTYKSIIEEIEAQNVSTFSEFAEYFLNQELGGTYKAYFEQVSHFTGDITSKQFLEFFKLTYNEPIATSSPLLGQLKIQTLDDLCLDRTRHTFILGMNETQFPKQIKDTALILNEDIELLKSENLTRPLSTLEQLGILQNDLVKLLSLPVLSCTFSYAQSSSTGATLLPASLYSQLKSNVKMETLNISYRPIEEDYLKSQQSEVYKDINTLIDDYSQHRHKQDHLSKETTNQIYSEYASVSQLELYNKCPFQYFLKYGLKLKESYQDDLSPAEIGSLSHYVLSLCFDHDRAIEEIVQEFLDQNERIKDKIQTPINQYVIAQQTQDLKFIKGILEHFTSLSSLKILDKERFIKDTVAGLEFKGIVDRIDANEDYFSIIDYKSSAKDLNLELAKQGFNIQMLIYLDMLKKVMPQSPAGVFYFSMKKQTFAGNSLKDAINEEDIYKKYKYSGYIIDDEESKAIRQLDEVNSQKSYMIPAKYVKKNDGYKGKILSYEALDSLSEAIAEHIQKLYTDIHQGMIPVAPKGSDDNNIHMMVNPCHFCEFKTICNFDIFYDDYNLVSTKQEDDETGGEADAI